MKNPYKDKPWFKFLSNKYVWVLLFFSTWMLFLDNYSYFDHRFLDKQVSELEDNKEYYQQEIKKDEEQIKQLNNPEQIEKYAREKYYMKKDSEDIYIIEFEGDSIEKKIINLELLKIKIKMATNLFDDFDPVSSKQWKQKIQFELKGADYNESLIWNSPEDIKVKPFYHKDEFTKALAVTTKASEFKICQNIFVFDVEKSVERALDTLERGADSLRFTIEDDSIDVGKLLEKLPLENVAVYFNFKFFSIDFVQTIDTIIQHKKAVAYYNMDPIGQLARDGNWFTTKDKNNFDSLNLLSTAVPNSSIISIDATLYQNAGANMEQQLAYSLAHANEYFNRIPVINKPIVIQVAVGTNYFFEIAKLRALRLLFNLVAKEYNHNLECHLLVSPTKRNKTLYDYNVNMLRTTTECMSAIIGGADAIANLPYDSLYHKDNEFGDRIARNQLLVLKNESYFDKVNNPADGSYYIETLTAQLAEKALVLFKNIEANGGFLKQLNEGVIKRKIQESADKEQELFDSGKEILLGTNKYPNKDDRMKQDLELFPFVKVKPRKTLITPIIEKRLAEKVEQERLDLEQ